MKESPTDHWALSWQDSLPQIRTERLNLRLCSPADAPSVVRYLVRNRTRLEQWEATRSDEFYLVETWIRSLRDEQTYARRGEGFRFRLFEKDRRHDVIGVVSLRNIMHGAASAAEIGYSIDKTHEGQGLMYEAASAVIRYAFDYLNLHRLEAICMPSNERSRELLIRLGFEQEGLLRGVLRIQGEWQDHILHSRINEHWRVPQPNPD